MRALMERRIGRPITQDRWGARRARFGPRTGRRMASSGCCRRRECLALGDAHEDQAVVIAASLTPVTAEAAVPALRRSRLNRVVTGSTPPVTTRRGRRRKEQMRHGASSRLARRGNLQWH
jgi:hypothetical protein